MLAERTPCVQFTVWALSEQVSARRVASWTATLASAARSQRTMLVGVAAGLR